MSEAEVLILKHVSNEGAGTILDFLKRENIRYRFIELYRGEKLPEPARHIRAVCVMGGPMNVYEEEKHPFLKEENDFIKEILGKSIPCLGVCLGSQLIAKALGSKVYKAAIPEIGWSPVRLTQDAKNDALFQFAPFPELRVLQWHEDTFDLPRGAVLLASTQKVPHQAYRIGKNAWGLQFHVEVDRPMLEDWFKNHSDRETILTEYDVYREDLARFTLNIYRNFFA